MRVDTVDLKGLYLIIILCVQGGYICEGSAAVCGPGSAPCRAEFPSDRHSSCNDPGRASVTLPAVQELPEAYSGRYQSVRSWYGH